MFTDIGLNRCSYECPTPLVLVAWDLTDRLIVQHCSNFPLLAGGRDGSKFLNEQLERGRKSLSQGVVPWPGREPNNSVTNTHVPP
jgi:hypothetical protein